MCCRTLWATNVESRPPGGAAGARGPSKRHAAGGGGGGAMWVPGSKIPLYHYPSDRQEVKGAALPQDDLLQYMEG